MYFAIPFTMDTIRVVFGPLPLWLCTIGATTKHFVVLNVAQITLILTCFKFSFIFFFKTIPIMEDNFLSLFIYISVNITSGVMLLIRYHLLQRPFIAQVRYHICSSMLFHKRFIFFR